MKELLKRDGRFTDEEIEIIAIAVKNHSKKSEIGSPIEEIVKDADVLSETAWSPLINGVFIDLNLSTEDLVVAPV